MQESLANSKYRSNGGTEVTPKEPKLGAVWPKSIDSKALQGSPRINPLKTNDFPAGTPDTRSESMSGESFGSRAARLDFSTREFSGREGGGKSYNQRTPLWREQPPWVI